MQRLVFERLSLHYIIGRCDARDVAPAGLRERSGLRREVHFRENELLKGVCAADYVYALLATE